MTSPLVGDLLERWPTLEQLQRAHPGTLRKFFHDHNCRSAEKNEERIAAIYQATPATKDQAVVEGCALIARGLVALLKTLRANIAAFDKRIAELAAAHPDTAIFASLPGAGAVLVPRLIVAFGTRRDRYQDAYEVQCYSGIAPVTESSGNSEWVHFRFACPKFLRQTFHEFAGCFDPVVGMGQGILSSISARRRTSRITRQSGAWRSNGFASFSGAGRTANPMTRRSTCSPCADVVRCSWVLSE